MNSDIEALSGDTTADPVAGLTAGLTAGLAADLGTTDYDGFAGAYATETESSLLNAYYSRPAILDLAGDVTGRRILDIGCGTGPLMASLRDRGAVVTGAEPSAKMLELARERLGPGADLRQAGLGGDPLPFADGAFDDVIACLVLHYLEDWTGPLRELRRVLVPGGRLIVAVNHPFVNHLQYPDTDYFAVREYSEENIFDGQKATLTFWHRSLDTMSKEFNAAGFRTVVVSEPPPAEGAREAFPEVFDQIFEKVPNGTAFICFLFYVLEAV